MDYCPPLLPPEYLMSPPLPSPTWSAPYQYLPSLPMFSTNQTPPQNPSPPPSYQYHYQPPLPPLYHYQPPPSYDYQSPPPSTLTYDFGPLQTSSFEQLTYAPPTPFTPSYSFRHPPTYIYPTSHCDKVGYAAPPSPCLTMHTQTVSAAADPYATFEATTQYTCGSPTSFLPQTMGKDRDAQSRMLKPRPTTTWKKRKTLLCNSDLGFYRARKVFDIMLVASGLGGAYYFRNRRAGSTTAKPWGSQSSTSHLRGHQDAQNPTMRGTGGSGRGVGKSGASQAVDSRKLVGRGSGWQQATARNYDNRSMAPHQAIPPKLERGWNWQSRAASTQPKGPEVNRDNYNHVVDDDKDVVSQTESDDDDLSDEFDILKGGLGDKVLEQDDVVVLNTMLNPDNALLALNYFQRIFKPKREVVLYNVTLKVFRKCKDLERAEKLFYEMPQRGVTPDNVTFSTLISCARMCYLPDKVVELFEKMPSYGCNPDDVTYSAMIDTYGSAGNVDKAFSLYDHARTEKWRIDPVTFATLIKIHGQSGNYDGCLNVYEEMKTGLHGPTASVTTK